MMCYRLKAHYNDQYDNQVNMRNSSSQMFPIFPWLEPHSVVPPNGPTVVEVRVGSSNVTENATEQVEIVYYY